MQKTCKKRAKNLQNTCKQRANAWQKNAKLFHVPTSMSVNAAFGHRAGVRVNSEVKYIGWTTPEAVYVDYDII